jgi:hypothetical protein
VLGVRVFREKEQPTPPPAPVVQHHHHYHTKYVYPWNPYYTGGYVYPTYSTGNVTLGNNVVLSGGTTTAATTAVTYTSNGDTFMAKGVAPTPSINYCATADAGNSLRGMTAQVSNVFDSPISYKDFDAGTTWGKKQVDKVKKEYFEKGAPVTELVMYYATREALFKMGVDLEDEPRIAESPLPQPFGGRYCQPPKGWQG